MSSHLENVDKSLDTMALEVMTLESDDIPAIGNMLNFLNDLEDDSRSLDNSAFSDLTHSIKAYLEKLILKEADDITPLEEGIESLQSICRALINQSVFEGDISSTLKRLGSKRSETAVEKSKTEDEKEEEAVSGSQGQMMDEEDRGILWDFIVEAQDNLQTIEVSLINLEQDPSDLETINTIFRPFHTIKGVSGFLNLNKVNKLAHSAENLLDKARDGEIVIDTMIVDIILDAVDKLKRLIIVQKDRLEGAGSSEEAVDIAPLLTRIEEINSRQEAIGDKPVGEILVQKGAITSEDLDEGLERQKEEPDKKIGEIFVEAKLADSKEVVSALRDQKKFGKRRVDLHVKVDTRKLDNLVDLTGEMVIAQAMLRQNPYISSVKDQKVIQNLGQLKQITSGLQMTAMSMRMVPVKHTFQKMVRLVRDLSKNSGKEVVLEMYGEDTEIDRNVVEELYEPMVHMIRNALDHGIESPDERESAGKERRGNVTLRAYHKGGNIIIEITDDGKGLNKDRIIEKAKKNNLIDDESKLTETEIFDLIFQPGLSTAKEVTDISGRGVGMDVVKKAIEKLRGRVEITSDPGHGSTFIISLPLTLAVIEGMMVRVGKEKYVIPTLAILESFRPSKDQCSTVEGKEEMILLRGTLIPLIRLDRLFGVQSDSYHPWEGLVVAIENAGVKRCILLDELLGKEEVVIKSLGESLKETKGIAGGAIMGDGRVGLILDMAGIFELAMNEY